MIMIKRISAYIVLLILMGGCSNNRHNETSLNDIGDYMIKNLMQAKEFSLLPYYQLTDINGKSCRVDSIVKSPLLVFRFNEFHCDNCIISCIEQIKTSRITDNIIGLASYNNVRMLNIIKKKYNIPFPVYLMPINDQEMLSDLKEKSEYPYLFLLDTDFRANYLFSPSQLYPDIFEKYLENISQILYEDKKGYIEIFTSKNIDLGTIIKGEKYNIDFEYTNTTNDLLIINDVKTSCGCMVSEWKKEPLSPQKTAKLIIEFTPETLGYTSKAIVVSHNKSTNPVRLMIRANVITKEQEH